MLEHDGTGEITHIDGQPPAFLTDDRLAERLGAYLRRLEQLESFVLNLEATLPGVPREIASIRLGLDELLRELTRG